jgi:hypothetical protein
MLDSGFGVSNEPASADVGVVEIGSLWSLSGSSTIRVQRPHWHP